MADKKKDFEKIETDLAVREKALDEREKALNTRENALKNETVFRNNELSDDAKAVIDEACKAFGISSEFVFSSGIDSESGAAVIVTNGGKKVKFFSGDEVEPLSEVEITGENRNQKKRKPLTGK